MPERVAVFFSAHWAFSIFERNIYIYTKNTTKEYQPRNLNVLDENGRLISEKKKLIDW